MSGGKRVPIPWKQRWHRFRHGTLPLLCFLGSVVVTLWLWDRQGQLPNAVGEVEAVRIDIVASADGVLAPLGGRDWGLFDPVPAGAVVAQIDDRAVRAEVTRIQMDLERSRNLFAVRMGELEFETRVAENAHLRDAARLAADLERHRLSVLDRRAQLEVDRVELAARNARIEFLAPMHEKNVVGEIEFREEELLRDLAARRVAESETLLAEAERHQGEVEQLVENFPNFPTEEIGRILAPLRQAIKAHELDLDGLEAMVEMLALRSPIAGTVAAIYRRPGQGVQAGDVIMTIASEKAEYVVSYVRQDHRLQPVAGMPVELRARVPGSRPVAATVDRVGSQYELILPPHQQLRDPTRPEWGLPVRISVPTGITLHPGELIDVTFRPDLVQRRG